MAMSQRDLFPKVAAEMPESELASRLADIEKPTKSEPEDGAPVEAGAASSPADLIEKGRFDRVIELWHGKPPIWKSNAHAFGYIPEAKGDRSVVDIIDVGDADPDKSLQNGRINVTLNFLRVASYPGGGTHRILFDFYAQNQTVDGTEEVHFNAAYRVLEGESAGLRGFPIFVGLGIGTEGLSLRCYTVNVKNDDDEKLLNILDSDVFKNGLRLASSVQPAIAPLTGFAVGLTKSLASRNRNIPVQDITMGLDFKKTPGGGRLAQGAYVLVQIPEKDRIIWSWPGWIFQKSTGRIINRTDSSQLIPYNYIVIGISKYGGK
jgi:hypothetical protein